MLQWFEVFFLFLFMIFYMHIYICTQTCYQFFRILWSRSLQSLASSLIPSRTPILTTFVMVIEKFLVGLSILHGFSFFQAYTYFTLYLVASMCRNCIFITCIFKTSIIMSYLNVRSRDSVCKVPPFPPTSWKVIKYRHENIMIRYSFDASFCYFFTLLLTGDWRVKTNWRFILHLMPYTKDDDIMLSLGISTGEGINSVALVYWSTKYRYILFAFGHWWLMESCPLLVVLTCSFSIDVPEETNFT